LRNRGQSSSAGCPCVGRLQVKDHRQGLVDSFHLLDRQETDRLGEAAEVHGGKLVAHDQGLPIGDVHWWPEAGLACAGAGEGDDPGAERELVRLQHDGVPTALLLVALTSRWQPVDLTPHAARPCPAGSCEFQQGQPGRP